MEIQKLSDTNFKARKVLTTQRFYKIGKTPKTETIDIFELDQVQDRVFVQKCYNILRQIHTRKLAPLQKQIKIFFKDFLENNSLSAKNYYLAIKNSETIFCGIASTPYNNNIYITQAFSEYPKNYNLENILYGFLNNSEENYPNYGIKTNGYITTLNPEIAPKEINNIKRKINFTHQGTYYDLHKEDNVDLEEVLDIKDFETDFLL